DWGLSARDTDERVATSTGPALLAQDGRLVHQHEPDDAAEFDVALGGPASLISTLGQARLTLAAGASQLIPVTAGSRGFAVQGPLGLTATATSHSNPSVRAAASATIRVSAATGLTAQFAPRTQLLAAPRPAPLPLMVTTWTFTGSPS